MPQKKQPLSAVPPAGMRASWLAEGGLVVLSVPLAPPSPMLAELTAAQRRVVEGVLAGRTGAQIAAAQGVSRATVYRQLEQVYRRLGVRSRAELAALIAGTRAR